MKKSLVIATAILSLFALTACGNHKSVNSKSEKTVTSTSGSKSLKDIEEQEYQESKAANDKIMTADKAKIDAFAEKMSLKIQDYQNSLPDMTVATNVNSNQNLKAWSDAFAAVQSTEDEISTLVNTNSGFENPEFQKVIDNYISPLAAYGKNQTDTFEAQWQKLISTKNPMKYELNQSASNSDDGTN